VLTPLRDWLAAIAACIAVALPVMLTRPAAPVVTRSWDPPRRIVSAALAADEILLELVDHERISGLTYLIDEPFASAVAGRAPGHATRVHGAVEPMLALLPDLVIVAPYLPGETLALLNAAHAPVLRFGETHSFEDVFDNVRLVGRATFSDQRADELIASLRARLRAVKGLAPPQPRPRMLVWAHGYAFGSDTLVDDCIRRAGGRNAVTARGEVAIGVEGALGLEPEVIVVTTNESSVKRNDRALLGDAKPWRGVRAVVHGVPAAWLGSVSHHAVLALEAMAALVREVP
jgi:iron complex transport system substrate-binding protein